MTTDDGPTIFSTSRLPAAAPGNRWSRQMRRLRKPTRIRGAIGRAPAHWGEFIQGRVRRGNDAVVALVTVPDRTYETVVVATPHEGSGVFCAQPGKWKSFAAACRTLHVLDAKTGLWLHVESNIPPGVGGGSSTSDCTATARAVRAMLGAGARHLSDLEILQEIVFPAEGPCDPLALLDSGFPVLWASRTGEVLHVYNRPLPAFHALGFVADSQTIVSTDDLAAKQKKKKPTDKELDAFAAVLKKFDAAMETGSARGIAEAAEESGTLNQSECAIRNWDRLRRLSKKVGALGISCSHSGTAAAFLWDAHEEDLQERVVEATAALTKLDVTYIHEFRPS